MQHSRAGLNGVDEAVVASASTLTQCYPESAPAPRGLVDHGKPSGGSPLSCFLGVLAVCLTESHTYGICNCVER